MNISLILAHPDKRSFNHAIAEAVVRELVGNGHNPSLHDLYAEGFEPLLPSEEIPAVADLPDSIQAYCREIASAEGLVVIHPNWWGMPPAILKGWVDRIIRPGVAYRFLEGDGGEGVPVGLLKAESAIVFNTSNTGQGRETEVFGDPLETIWRNCIFGLCGVSDFHRRTFGVVATSTLAEREQWLSEARKLTATVFPRNS